MGAFNTLLNRHGNYSLPYLIYIRDDKKNIELYLCNNDEDLTYNGKIYKASSFTYKPSSFEHGFSGGGELVITTIDNTLIELTREYSHILLDVVGAIEQDTTITPIKTYKNEYGNITVKKGYITFNFAKDDRLEMTFPTLIWSAINNRGNN